VLPGVKESKEQNVDSSPALHLPVARCMGTIVLGVRFTTSSSSSTRLHTIFSANILLRRAHKNPRLNYTVILNPCSGPCLNSLPEQAYIDEIPKLAAYPNIRKLGYVSTNYTDRLLETVLAEIRQYSLWPSVMNDTRMNVDGIFFDEVSAERSTGEGVC